MSLATRCPICEALFRVTPDQLRARAGQVRCGRCNAVFDGLAHLVPESDLAASLGAGPQAGTVAQQPTAIESLDFVLDSQLVQPPAPEGALAPRTRSEPDTVVNQGHPIEAAVASAPVEGGFLDEKSAGWRNVWRRDWPSILASALLALLLVMQIALRQRDALAAEHPGLRPILTTICRALGCELGLPRTPQHLSIEDDEMIAADPGTPGRVTLIATLRNTAPFAVAYPSLELTLQNARNEVLARRVLGPADYLERGTQLAEGLAARSDANLRLALDTGAAPAEGYRLLVFYPETP